MGGRSVALRPPPGSWPGSAALGGAGLAVLVALVAGLLALAAAGLTALATATHLAAHPGRQR